MRTKKHDAKRPNKRQAKANDHHPDELVMRIDPDDRSGVNSKPASPFGATAAVSKLTDLALEGEQLRIDISNENPAGSTVHVRDPVSPLVESPIGETDAGMLGDPPTCGELDCDDDNECTMDGCADSACTHVALEDGSACTYGEGAGLCSAGKCVADCSKQDCRPVYPCTEEGIREAIRDDGEVIIGCEAPTTVMLTEGVLEIVKDLSLDGLGNPRKLRQQRRLALELPRLQCRAGPWCRDLLAQWRIDRSDSQRRGNEPQPARLQWWTDAHPRARARQSPHRRHPRR
jgi:hypothetical protein